MKKTNIRVRNKFVIEDEKEYYISSIKENDKWRELKDKDIEKYKEEKITPMLTSLMEKYDIYAAVNFFIEDEKKRIILEKDGGG
tara:strand:- start:70 stop:321 length:252 start_codon:yes stop_codon:yes gene_type:complete